MSYLFEDVESPGLTPVDETPAVTSVTYTTLSETPRVSFQERIPLINHSLSSNDKEL